MPKEKIVDSQASIIDSPCATRTLLIVGCLRLHSPSNLTSRNLVWHRPQKQRVYFNTGSSFLTNEGCILLPKIFHKAITTVISKFDTPEETITRRQIRLGNRYFPPLTQRPFTENSLHQLLFPYGSSRRTFQGST